MTAIACPALDGREPLGFLAALGTLRLLADHADPAATLHWSTTDASAVVPGEPGTNGAQGSGPRPK